MREKVINSIVENKIVAIIRGVESSKLVSTVEAMYEGGIRLVEVTYSANGSVSDEETAKNIETLAKQFEGRMFIGAGTVLSEKQVELTQKAGGKFIISPDANPSVIAKTRELNMVSIPGALTPTEAAAAHNAGADFVKLFPITSLGPQYVKAVRAPLSHIKFLAVGGVDLSNMRDYLNVGISGFGIGSNITPKKAIEEGNFEEITALSKKYVEIVK